MLLPNGAKAIVDISKLQDYCLNPDSPRGSNKARVFAAALGITASESEFLREKLLRAAATNEVIPGEFYLCGKRYVLDFEIITKVGTATVRSGWIVLSGENYPRLTTCYVLKEKRNAEKEVRST